MSLWDDPITTEWLNPIQTGAERKTDRMPVSFSEVKTDDNDLWYIPSAAQQLRQGSSPNLFSLCLNYARTISLRLMPQTVDRNASERPPW